VYHHFHNREGLIAAVEVQRLLEQLRQANSSTREFISQAESTEVIFGAIEFVLRMAGSEEGKQNRRRRIATMAAAQSIPVLADTIIDIQIRGDEYMAGTLQIAVDNGLIAPTESLLGIAQWIGSLTLGRATVDLATDIGGDEQWLSTTMFSLRALLNPLK
jgi:AcrR family transcriptional regulator